MRGEALGFRHVILVCALGLGTGETALAQNAPIVLSAGTDHARTTIPVSVNGVQVRCVLDTGASTMLLSQDTASMAGVTALRAVDEISPDGMRYTGHAARIARLGVGGITVRDVPALISSNRSNAAALCGYGFFDRFPTLIDRDRSLVTLFPADAALNAMRCLRVDLSTHVPVSTVLINGTPLSNVVLDSGMSGGGILWNGALTKLAHPLTPLVTTRYDPDQSNLSCGRNAMAAFFADLPAAFVQLCTSATPPAGYDGMLQTNLSTVHRLGIDYAARRVCFS
ncbi:MAG TPA: retropepsin-like aspartic protease [Candidatus Acidoferrales bacterium]|nr:retropepsin-like aspartic protease [Candidatus Acidoferrales bacterium]